MMRWENGALLGEFTTRSFGEHPSVDVESHLLSILEECPLPRYYLSEKCAMGIIRRAAQKTKQLPEILLLALRNQVANK